MKSTCSSLQSLHVYKCVQKLATTILFNPTPSTSELAVYTMLSVVPIDHITHVLNLPSRCVSGPNHPFCKSKTFGLTKRWCQKGQKTLGNYMGVSKNRGENPPKWMVKIMDNLIKHGIIWGENQLFLETPIYEDKDVLYMAHCFAVFFL